MGGYVAYPLIHQHVTASQSRLWSIVVGAAVAVLVAIVIGSARASRIVLGIIVGAIAGIAATFAAAAALSSTYAFRSGGPIVLLPILAGVAIWIGVAVAVGKRR